MSQRTWLEGRIAERAAHRSSEDVGITCSFARAERLLGREYHGRFLIELLQNAADACRGDQWSEKGGARVHIALTDAPCLVVANQGVPITARTIVTSLGHIGASTKTSGEAIGHKGIGFKSVLEISDAPEIYSGLQSSEPLAVGFRPDAAIDLIRAASPGWDAELARIDNVDPDDPRTWVPVLRYPTWIDDVPSDVTTLSDQGYDTVVRLPLVATDGGDVEKTVADVRSAMRAVTDEILLLLANFREVALADATRGWTQVVRPEVLNADGTGEDVRVRRNGAVSSAWRLYRDRLVVADDSDDRDGDSDGLASELTVGLRVDGDEAVGIEAGTGGSPFHLFFPTHIPSGTPLLLHGYFEVNASRTAFYDGSDERNRAILDGLSRLAADAVHDALQHQPELAVSLASALAEPTVPSDPLVREFWQSLFDRLDHVPWVPIADGDGPRLARPAKVLSLPVLNAAVHRVFPSHYVVEQLGQHLPDARLSRQVLELLRKRQGGDAHEELEDVENLLLPGDHQMWEPSTTDQRFRALLDLIDAMHSLDRDATDGLLTMLRSHPDSRIVPTVAEEGIALSPCADPASGRAGEASRVIMARVRRTTSTPLSPPEAFDIDFVPDGLLSSEDEVDRAKPLGVRQFTVDSVLDRLGTIDLDDAPDRTLRFLGRLLDREHASGFGVRQHTDRAEVFDPTGWFWCRPRRNLDRTIGAPRQRRERILASVRVPCRDGSWRPAGTVAFGGDWADWIGDNEVGGAADRPFRQATMRALEELAPGDEHLLAAPQQLLEVLDWSSNEPDRPSEPDGDMPAAAELRMLAFLLRLGVWQVLPVEAWDDLTQANRRPWPGLTDDRREQAVEGAGGWVFDWVPDRVHENVHIGEDFRFLWPLETLSAHDAGLLAQALQAGLPLYRQLLHASVFCPGCGPRGASHTARRRSGPGDRFPSHLATELRHQRWVPATRGGEDLPSPVAPVSCWWGSEPLGASVLHQHPERFLDRTDPTLGVDRDLARVADLRSVETASIGRLDELLGSLRDRLHDGLGDELTSSGLARQAFIGLHRRIYLRLADLQPEQSDEVGAAIAATGVLCERGNQLAYVAPGEARHDDGTHASHLRYFADGLARVVLPRDAREAARRLGIPPLGLTFHRQGDDEGIDVTDELVEVLHDRIPELLAILVHHSQGSQTLEPTSRAFEQRARRLQRLRVRRLNDLVLEVRVTGTDLREVLGRGANRDFFLDGPTRVDPVLFHDLAEPDWHDRIRRHLAPHVAALAENPAYEHTFEAFFNREGHTEREHFLLSLGIRPQDVDRIADRVGTVSDAARRRRQRWFAAVMRVFGQIVDPVDADLDAVPALLEGAGLGGDIVARLVELGGDAEVRRDPSPDGAMATLAACGVALTDLDAALQELDDDGLAPGVAETRFRLWRETHRWPVLAVLAPQCGMDEGRASLQGLRAPSPLRLSLDPSWPELLQPVVALLARHGLHADADGLAHDPLDELAHAAGHGSVEELRQAVEAYSDTATWHRELRARAARWRDILVDLAVLASLPPDSTRAHIRELDTVTGEKLPHGMDQPSEIGPHLDILFPDRPELARDLSDRLVDEVAGPSPSLDQVAPIAEAHGVPMQRHGELMAARSNSHRRTDRLRKRRTALEQADVRPAVPHGLVTVMREPAQTIPVTTGHDQPESQDVEAGPRPVRKIKVDASADRSKRKTGDEGEQWALAATLGALEDLDPVGRERAIDVLSGFLSNHFAGAAVDELLEHGMLARTVVDTDEEFLDTASRLLHVSKVSDAFGFDVLGWRTGARDDETAPVCLEVKSTGGGKFNLSSGEWSLAEDFHRQGLGGRYAVLAVVRGPAGGAPARMDLLPDPVSLVRTGKLTQTVDGYRLSYRVGP